jgi:hypothetical protein
MSLAIDPRGAANPKLPLWDTICLSYSTYFYNLQDVLRISWLWLVVVVPLTGIANWLQWSWMAVVMADLKRGMPPRPDETMVFVNVAGLVFTLAGFSIAVAWHRRIILGEHPRFSGSNIATKNLWRYVGVGLAICILPALVVVLPMLLLLAGAPGFTNLIPVIFLLFLVAFAVVLRLSLLLPAFAVGDLGLTFKETWNGTRRNTWRIFWGIAACTMLPMLLAAQITRFPSLGTFVASPGLVLDARRMAVTSTIVSVCYLLILPIGIGFLSYSYRHFFRRT